MWTSLAHPISLYHCCSPKGGQKARRYWGSGSKDKERRAISFTTVRGRWRDLSVGHRTLRVGAQQLLETLWRWCPDRAGTMGALASILSHSNPILSYPIPSYTKFCSVLSYPNSVLFHSILSHSILSCPILFYPVLSCSNSILSYAILFLFYSIPSHFIPSNPIQSYSILSSPILIPFCIFLCTLPGKIKAFGDTDTDDPLELSHPEHLLGTVGTNASTAQQNTPGGRRFQSHFICKSQ